MAPAVFAGWRFWLLLALAAMALMAPSLAWGPPEIDSGVYNYTWTRQFGEALARGELYPRYLPDSSGGFGSPTFYFYPPLAFYVSGLFQVAGFNTSSAIVAAGLCALLASGATMTLWLRSKGANPLWALLYMAAPYHLTDWYQRAALAEFFAFAWIPLIALALEAQPKRWATPLLAVSFAGLVMTHLPMAVLVSAFLILPLVVAHRKYVVANAIAGAFGLGLSAIYLLPAMTLQDHIAAASMWMFGYQPSQWAPWGPIPNAWVWPLALAPCALVIGRPRFWPVLTFVGAAMSLALVPIFWKLPILEQVQFPWRLLAVVEFSAVTAAALWRPGRVMLALAVMFAAQALVRMIPIAAFALKGPTPVEWVRDLPDFYSFLPAGSDVDRAGIPYRPLDRSAVRPPTLTARPPPVVSQAAGISLATLMLGALASLLRACRVRRPSRRPKPAASPPRPSTPPLVDPPPR